MTTISTITIRSDNNTRHGLTINGRVPHTSILMCGHRAKLDRFPFPTPKTRHPERSSLRTLQAVQSKDSDTPHITKTARTISTRNAVVVFALAVASEIGPGFSPDIPGPTTKPGFSPWGMLSSPYLNHLSEATA
jgi:hypothetical protein